MAEGLLYLAVTLSMSRSVSTNIARQPSGAASTSPRCKLREHGLVYAITANDRQYLASPKERREGFAFAEAVLLRTQAPAGLVRTKRSLPWQCRHEHERVIQSASVIGHCDESSARVTIQCGFAQALPRFIAYDAII